MAAAESSDIYDDEIIRLIELQRRHRQRFYESGEPIDAHDIDRARSSFSFHNRRPSGSSLTRPPVPDMRFEQQFNQTVASLKAEGATPLQIFLSAVVVNQFIMPFINGFSWCLLSHLWRWSRIRSKYPAAAEAKSSTTADASSSSSFVRGLKYGIAKWFR